MLGFIMARLALAICLERPSLAIVLGRIKWVVTECNLRFFGAKGHTICVPPLDILNSLLVVGQNISYWIGDLSTPQIDLLIQSSLLHI